MPKETIWTTQSVISEFGKKHGTHTAYGVAKFSGASQASARRWVRGEGTLDEQYIELFANELDIAPAWLAFCISLERTKSVTLQNQMHAFLSKHAQLMAG